MSESTTLLHDLARKRLLQLMRIVSEDCTACGWAGGIETELPPAARAKVAGTRAKLDDDTWFMSGEMAAEMVALADLLALGDRWFANPYEPDPREEP